MKFSSVIKLLILISPSLCFAKNSVYKVDKKTSVVKWEGSKPTGSHDGTVNVSKGNLTVDDKGLLQSGIVEIDMKSIKNIDLKGKPDYQKKLENHLKSPDFFDVKNHSTAVLTIKSVKYASDKKSAKVSGSLVIRGKSKPISFDASFVTKGKNLTMNSKLVINRADWDIKYKSKSFFDVKVLADKIIYDDMKFDVNLVAASK